MILIKFRKINSCRKKSWIYKDNISSVSCNAKIGNVLKSIKQKKEKQMGDMRKSINRCKICTEKLYEFRFISNEENFLSIYNSFIFIY